MPCEEYDAVTRVSDVGLGGGGGDARVKQLALSNDIRLSPKMNAVKELQERGGARDVLV
jgi:hypothetical protein